MKISKEEFLQNLEEGQNILLELLADSPEVDPEQFYKIVKVLETISFFGGFIYSIITPSNKNDRMIE